MTWYFQYYLNLKVFQPSIFVLLIHLVSNTTQKFTGSEPYRVLLPFVVIIAQNKIGYYICNMVLMMMLFQTWTELTKKNPKMCCLVPVNVEKSYFRPFKVGWGKKILGDDYDEWQWHPMRFKIFNVQRRIRRLLVEETEAPLLEVLTRFLEAVEAINNCANTMKKVSLLEAVLEPVGLACLSGRSRLFKR